MYDPSRRYWGAEVHSGGLGSTRPLQVQWMPDASGGAFIDPDVQDYECSTFVAHKLGMHRDGDNARHVTFVSERREDVVAWMKGVAAGMAVIREWASQGFGDLSHTERYGDETVFNVIINGKLWRVDKGSLTYEEVVFLAGFEPDRTLSVTFRRGQGGISGLLSPQHSVVVVEGLVFNVADTSNA